MWVADGVQEGADGLFVSKGALLVRQLIGHLACLDHLAYQLLDGGDAMGDFADQLFAVGTEDVILLRCECLAQAAQVLQQAVLVDDCGGDDVVDGQVAQHAALDLHLHGVFLQLHF